MREMSLQVLCDHFGGDQQKVAKVRLDSEYASETTNEYLRKHIYDCCKSPVISYSEGAKRCRSPVDAHTCVALGTLVDAIC